jgi:hypothetical protein
MEKCQKIPIDKLIAYCDSELQPDETQHIAEHINSCQNCQEMMDALQDSLKLAQDVWQTDTTKWGDLHSFIKPYLHTLPIIKIASVAAVIILIFSLSLIYLLSNSNEQLKPPVLTAKEIELQAERSAIAAQLLAVGDMYAAQTGAEKYAVERYNDLIESFPSSPQSEQAKLHLQKLLERKIQ